MSNVYLHPSVFGRYDHMYIIDGLFVGKTVVLNENYKAVLVDKEGKEQCYQQKKSKQ